MGQGKDLRCDTVATSSAPSVVSPELGWPFRVLRGEIRGLGHGSRQQAVIARKLPLGELVTSGDPLPKDKTHKAAQLRHACECRSHCKATTIC